MVDVDILPHSCPHCGGRTLYKDWDGISYCFYCGYAFYTANRRNATKDRRGLVHLPSDLRAVNNAEQVGTIAKGGIY